MRDVRRGLLAEFETPEALLVAVDRLRALGYTRIDAYTPYPVHGLEDRLALPRSKAPLVMFCVGLSGAAFGYVVQWWCNAIDYPINVGGRPLHSAPAFIPITFESMVLFASISGFVALLLFARLPRLWHPVFEVEGFERASVDRFWVGVDAGDPRFDGSLANELLACGALRTTNVGADVPARGRP